MSRACSAALRLQALRGGPSDSPLETYERRQAVAAEGQSRLVDARIAEAAHIAHVIRTC